MSYKVQEIFKWFNQFNKEEIKIKGENKEFEIEINNKSLPHLLGLQYMEKINNQNSSGRRIYNYVRNNNLSDENILKRVSINNPHMTGNVRRRINTLQYFLENIENGYIVEKTDKSGKLKSNYLIIQTKDNFILHLGLKQDEIEDRIENFTVFEKDTYLETYFSRNDNKYYKGSQIMEKVTGLYRYNEDIGLYENFSFSGHSLDKLNENNIFKEVYKNKENDFER